MASRASVAEEATTLPFPAFMSLMDCKISAPISRFASNTAISVELSFLDFEGTTNLLESNEGDVLRLGLGIQGEQVDLAKLVPREVDDSNTTGLARSLPHLTHLADAARAANDGASFWIQCDERREVGALFFIPVPRPELLEDRTLNDGEHAELYV